MSEVNGKYSFGSIGCRSELHGTNSSREQANMDSAILAILEMRTALAEQSVALSADAERLSAALDAVVRPPQRVRERETQPV
jgi:hypothetical protein